MANATAEVATTWISRATAVTAACGTTAAAVGWYIYNQLVTNPLRCFYFKGWVWGNVPLSEVCFRITNVESKWWSATQERMDECRLLTEREFESWDATVMTSLYFTALTFGVLQLTCHCCFIRPLLRAVRIVPNAQRRQRRDYASDREEDEEDELAEVRRRSASCANIRRPAAGMAASEGSRT